MFSVVVIYWWTLDIFNFNFRRRLSRFCSSSNRQWRELQDPKTTLRSTRPHHDFDNSAIRRTRTYPYDTTCLRPTIRRVSPTSHTGAPCFLLLTSFMVDYCRIKKKCCEIRDMMVNQSVLLDAVLHCLSSASLIQAHKTSNMLQTFTVS
jgi:hypothetical protein